MAFCYFRVAPKSSSCTRNRDFWGLALHLLIWFGCRQTLAISLIRRLIASVETFLTLFVAKFHCVTLSLCWYRIRPVRCPESVDLRSSRDLRSSKYGFSNDVGFCTREAKIAFVSMLLILILNRLSVLVLSTVWHSTKYNTMFLLNLCNRSVSNVLRCCVVDFMFRNVMSVFWNLIFHDTLIFVVLMIVVFWWWSIHLIGTGRRDSWSLTVMQSVIC